MVNSINSTPEFDHDKFNELVFELKKMGHPFIVVMQDANNDGVDRVQSMGNFDEYINGIEIMADLLHSVADSLSKIDEIENQKNKDN